MENEKISAVRGTVSKIYFGQTERNMKRKSPKMRHSKFESCLRSYLNVVYGMCFLGKKFYPYHWSNPLNFHKKVSQIASQSVLGASFINTVEVADIVVTAQKCQGHSKVGF